MSTTHRLGSLATLLLLAHLVPVLAKPVRPDLDDSGPQLKRRHVFKISAKPVNQVALSADGNTLAAALNQVDTKTWKRWTEFRVWDLTSNKELASFEENSDGSAALDLSPRGDFLASCTSRGRMLLWSIKQQRERAFSNLGGLSPRLRFSADGIRLGAASEKNILLATVSGDGLTNLKYRGRLSYRAFSPDLRFLACACHQDVDLLDPLTGKLHATLADHPGSVGFITFSGDGKTLAAVVGTYDGENHGSAVLVWDLARQTVRARLPAVGFCFSLGLSTRGEFAVLVTDKFLRGNAHELKAIDVATGKTTSSFRFERTQVPQCQAFSRDGKVVAIGCHDGSVQLFDVR